MPFGLTEASAILKNDYLGPVRNNVNEKKVLRAKIKKSSEEVSGGQCWLPLRSGRNTGVGARAYNTTSLPNAGSQQYKEATFPTKTVYGRVKIYGKTIRVTRNDKGAFIRAVKSELIGMSDDLADDLNRQHFTGNSGTLCSIVGAVNSATQTVTSTQYLFPGMIVDIGGLGARTVLSITSSTVVVFTTAVNTAGGELVVRTGVTAGVETNGLADIVLNSGTLQGVDPTTAAGAFWKASVFGIDATPVPLDEIDMEEAVDEAEKKGGEVDYVITSYTGRREYYKLLQSQKRFPDTVTLKGGFKAVMFNDIAMVVDKHCQEDASKTRMYFLSSKNLGHYRQCDLEWMEEDGAILARIVGSSGEEAYEGTMVADEEFATDFRGAHSVLLGIARS